jgi:hypothetical protein
VLSTTTVIGICMLSCHNACGCPNTHSCQTINAQPQGAACDCTCSIICASICPHPYPLSHRAGDHLSASYEAGSEGLLIFTDFNWYSVPLQLQSVAALLQYDFTTVLPGHGRRRHLRDAAHRLRAVSELLQSHGYDGQLPSAGGSAALGAGRGMV